MLALVAARLVVLIWCALSCVTAARGQIVAPDVREALVGTWTLVSIYEENDSGAELDRWGDDRHGRFIADRPGHFMLQLVGRNPIRLESPAQARACSRSAAYESIGYAGAYTIDEAHDVMTLKAEDALAPDFDRSLRTASISIEGHLLHFRSSAEASPTGAFYAHLVWKRAE